MTGCEALARNVANAAFVLAEAIHDLRAAVHKTDKDALGLIAQARLPRADDIHDIGHRARLAAERFAERKKGVAA